MKKLLFTLILMMSSLALFAQTPKAVLLHDDMTNETTLTFYYDNESHQGSTYSLNSGTNEPGWLSNTDITTVVFDSSFANALPTTTYH